MFGLIIILIAEYIGDFLLQDRDMALNKSKDVKVLMKHLGYIFATIVLLGAGLGSAIVPFAACYIVIHGIQDWFIWKGYKYIVLKRFPKERYTEESYKQRLLNFEKNKEYAEDKVFYDTIGLDRLLHVITLVILYGVFFL